MLGQRRVKAACMPEGKLESVARGLGVDRLKSTLEGYDGMRTDVDAGLGR